MCRVTSHPSLSITEGIPESAQLKTGKVLGKLRQVGNVSFLLSK